MEFSKQIRTSKTDEYYTPAYAVQVILPFLKARGFKHVWCPFDKEHSEFVIILKEEGFNVTFGQVQNTVRNVTAIFEDFNPTQTVTLGVESNTKAITDNIQDFQSQLRSNIADFNAQIADMMTNNYSYQFESGSYSNNIEVTYKNQEGEKLEVIKQAIDTVKRAVSRDTVLSVNGREFARATGDDINGYLANKQNIENLVRGLK